MELYFASCMELFENLAFFKNGYLNKKSLLHSFDLCRTIFLSYHVDMCIYMCIAILIFRTGHRPFLNYQIIQQFLNL